MIYSDRSFDGVLGQALAEVPESLEGIAALFGTPRERNRAIATELGVTIREVQRWRRTESGQTPRSDRNNYRRLPATRRQQLRAAARPRAVAANAARLRRVGLDMRIRATIRVSNTRRSGWFPTPFSEAHPRFAHVPGRLVGQAIDPFLAGDLDSAADRLEAGFWAAYWEGWWNGGDSLPENNPAEIETLDEVQAAT